jgi:hypothetical protein
MPVSSDSIRRAIDASAAAALGVVCVSGSALHNVQPMSDRLMGFSASPMTPSLFGLTSGRWSVIHDFASLLFLVLVLPNLYWGWGRISGFFRKGERTGSLGRAVAGLVAALTLAAFLIGGVGNDFDGEIPPPVDLMTPLLGEGSDARIGRMTLGQIETDLKVPAEYMRANLGLPANVSKTVPVGELMNRHTFTIDDVRNVIIMNQIQTQLPVDPSSAR